MAGIGARATYALVFVGVLGLSGCVSTLSDDRIREETSAALGVPAGEITISNVRQEMTNTFYTATTRSGAQYACILNGGNIMTLGMTNPAVCNRKAG
jgi:UDP-N-acetylglucosamine enolpyruvyl transferase